MSLVAGHPTLEPVRLFQAAATERMEESCQAVLCITIEVLASLSYTLHHLFFGIALSSWSSLVTELLFGATTRRGWVDAPN